MGACWDLQPIGTCSLLAVGRSPPGRRCRLVSGRGRLRRRSRKTAHSIEPERPDSTRSIRKSARRNRGGQFESHSFVILHPKHHITGRRRQCREPSRMRPAEDCHLQPSCLPCGGYRQGALRRSLVAASVDRADDPVLATVRILRHPERRTLTIPRQRKRASNLARRNGDRRFVRADLELRLGVALTLRMFMRSSGNPSATP